MSWPCAAWLAHIAARGTLRAATLTSCRPVRLSRRPARSTLLVDSTPLKPWLDESCSSIVSRDLKTAGQLQRPQKAPRPQKPPDPKRHPDPKRPSDPKRPPDPKRHPDPKRPPGPKRHPELKDPPTPKYPLPQRPPDRR
ncbi:myelin-associated oligodendrocyte basic protein-like [Bicyclus anynana]|uniref:Myelin-associated oligodendrocyte basic protein-like n=1 Tax=Bicyclus anynana TaxID=110368 RepID=A0ABM3LT95_BICAN|nr:myelin-associated oligodendrocyte basic protein-like [Bicyclus anynana]